MPHAHPSTPVFAFSELKNKAGELSVALNIGPGVLHELHATRPVWANLHRYLQQEFAPPAPRSAPAPAVVRRLRGKQRNLVCWTVLQRIEVTGLTRRAACAEARISLPTFACWLAGYRRQQAAAAATAQPSRSCPTTTRP